jgi:hypothetical protein
MMDIDRLRFDEVDGPWALACVDSRSNFLPDNAYSMTPRMLDMLNHDSRVKTSARVHGASRFLHGFGSLEVFQLGNLVERQLGKQFQETNDIFIRFVSPELPIAPMTNYDR